jgi:hypothetical protein
MLSTGNTKHITVIDTKGGEVSPFGKDRNNIPKFEDPDPHRGVKGTYVVKGLIPDKRYITGGELAFVAIMALASASRVRPGENAAQQGLSQVRREYVLVEEEPWLDPDYDLGEATPSGGTEVGSIGHDATDRRRKETRSQEKPLRAAQRIKGSRKILLRPQIIVQEGDNLSDMAEALFNDSRYGHLIADLNYKTIAECYEQKTRIVRLITRQRLSLPVYQDTVQFDARRLGEIGSCHLITIVESTAIDREAFTDGLSTMLGVNSKNRDPLQEDDRLDKDPHQTL